MKRAGFTMIELIFVIVILGILAAVAVPKLAATRTDAKVASMATEVNIVMSDIASYYTSKGEFGANWGDMTNAKAGDGVATATDIKFESKPGTVCIEFSIGTLTDAAALDGNVTIKDGDGAGAVCKGVQKKLKVMTNGTTGKTHSFGSSGVVE